MGIMAQIMGGPRSGTAMMSLFQQMAGGQMLKRTAQGMEALGLLGRRMEEWGGRRGWGWSYFIGRSQQAFDRNAWQKDPLQFAEKLKGVMEEKGITSNEDQMR